MDMSTKSMTVETAAPPGKSPLFQKPDEADVHMRASLLEQACLQLANAKSTDALNMAERHIRVEIRKSTALHTLTRMVSTSPHVHARQLGAVILRRVVKEHWNKLMDAGVGPGSPLHDLKAMIISRLYIEESGDVRRPLVAALAVVTQRLFKVFEKQQEEQEREEGAPPQDLSQLITPNSWADVAEFMVGGLANPSPGVRESVMVLYGFLALEAAHWMSDAEVTQDVHPAEREKRKANQALPSLEAFTRTLDDPDAGVRRAAMKSLQHVLEAMCDYDMNAEQSAEVTKIVPVVLSSVQKNVDEGDSDQVSAAMEAMEVLVLTSHKSITRYFASLVDALAYVMVAPNLSLSTRKAAAETLNSITYVNADNIVSGGHMQRLLEPLLKLSCDVMEAGGFEECGEDVFWSVYSQLTTCLPSEQGLDLLLPYIISMVQRPEAHVRATGLQIVSLMLEGAVELGEKDEKVREVLAIYKMIMDTCKEYPKLINDPDLYVSEAAIKVSYEILRMLRQIEAKHMLSKKDNSAQMMFDVMVPIIGRATELAASPDNRIKIVSCRLISKYVDTAHVHHVKQLAPVALNQAKLLLSEAKKQNKTEVTRASYNLVAAVADRLTTDFTPYFPEWVEILKEDLAHYAVGVYNHASQTLSQIAMAVGKETFRPHMKTFMQLAERSMIVEEDHSVQSSGIYFFASMCELLGAETAEVIPSFIPFLINVIKNTQIYDLVTVKNKFNVGKELPFAEDSTLADAGASDREKIEALEDVQDRLNDHKLWQLNSNSMDKLSTAVVALDYITHNAPKILEPYIKDAVNALLHLLPNPSGDLSTSVLDCQMTVYQVAQALYAAKPDSEKKEKEEMDKFLAEKSSTFVKLLMYLLDSEYQLTVTTKAVVGIDYFLTAFGPAAADPAMCTRILDAVDNIMHGSLYSQQHPEGFEEYVATIKKNAITMSPKVLRAMPADLAVTEYERVEKSLQSFFAGGIMRPEIISSLIQILTDFSDRGDLEGIEKQFISDKLELLMVALKDRDHRTRQHTLAGLLGLLEAYPLNILVQTGENEQQGVALVTRIMDLASARPVQEEDGEDPDRMAVSVYNMATTAGLWMLHVLSNFRDQIPAPIASVIESATQHQMIPMLQNIPYKMDPLPLSYTACMAVEKLFDANNPVFAHKQIQIEAINAVARTISYHHEEQESDEFGLTKEELMNLERFAEKMQQKYHQEYQDREQMVA